MGIKTASALRAKCVLINVYLHATQLLWVTEITASPYRFVNHLLKHAAHLHYMADIIKINYNHTAKFVSRVDCV